MLWNDFLHAAEQPCGGYENLSGRVPSPPAARVLWVPLPFPSGEWCCGVARRKQEAVPELSWRNKGIFCFRVDLRTSLSLCQIKNYHFEHFLSLMSRNNCKVWIPSRTEGSGAKKGLLCPQRSCSCSIGNWRGLWLVKQSLCTELKPSKWMHTNALPDFEMLC